MYIDNTFIIEANYKHEIKKNPHNMQSLQWKFEFTGPNQILELIFL